MKFATFIVLALAICVLLVSFAPQNSEASKKKLLKKAKKLAAIALLAKPKKLLGKQSGRLSRPVTPPDPLQQLTNCQTLFSFPVQPSHCR